MDAGTILDKSTWSLDYLIQTNWIWFVFKTALIFFIFLRIISIIWVAKDISARTHKTFLQIICILIITLLSPILWLPIYAIIRPIHYIKDHIPWREALALSLTWCYNCESLNPKENEFCTNCGEPLKLECKKCSHKSAYNEIYCADCWSPNFDS